MALGAAGDRAAALAHETMITLWRRWADLPGAPRTYARLLVVRGIRRSRADVVAPVPLRFPEQTQHGAVLTGLAQLPDGQGHVLAATFDHLPPEDIALVLQIGVDDVQTAADAGAVALRSHLDGREVRQAYDDLVAGVAGGMDVDAGLALVAANDSGRPDRRAVGAGCRHGPPADRACAGRAGRRGDVGRPGRRRAAARGDPPAGRAVLPRPARARRPLVPLRGRRGAGGVPRRPDRAAQLPRAGQAVPGVRLRDRRTQGDRRAPVGQPRRAADPVADVPDAGRDRRGPRAAGAARGAVGAAARPARQLPEKQREILVLRIVVGLSAEETAEIVGPVRVRSASPSTGRSAACARTSRRTSARRRPRPASPLRSPPGTLGVS